MPLLSSIIDRLRGERGDRPLQIGHAAPDFTLADSAGVPHTLSQALRAGPVVLAFYPRAFTLGCTRELRAYTRRQAELGDANLWAISVDDAATLARFKALLGASFAFLSDPDGKVAQLYAGVGFRGEAKRTTVTVGQDGRITRITAGLAAIFPDGDIAACTQIATP